jgi:molecular chaperone Hsp33
VALGRATTAGLLLATLTKGGERVTVQVLGDGPLGSITADASDGAVRGFVAHPRAGAVAQGAVRGSIGASVGRGLLNVLRDLGLLGGARGSGTAALTTGEIDEDLEDYLTVSEQIDSALGCDVVVVAGVVLAAGGVLVQCLPGGDEAAVARARGRMRAGAIHAALTAGAVDPRELAAAVVGADERLEVVDTRPVVFRCPCSRERVTAALALCGEAELRSILREDGAAEVTCNFCNERYRLGPEELARLLARD